MRRFVLLTALMAPGTAGAVKVEVRFSRADALAMEGRLGIYQINDVDPEDQATQNNGEWLASIWTYDPTFGIKTPFCSTPNARLWTLYTVGIYRVGESAPALDKGICAPELQLTGDNDRHWAVTPTFYTVDGAAGQQQEASIVWETKLPRYAQEVQIDTFTIPGTDITFRGQPVTVQPKAKEVVRLPVTRDPIVKYAYDWDACDGFGITIEGLRGFEKFGGATKTMIDGVEKDVLQCEGLWSLKPGTYQVSYSGRGSLQVVFDHYSTRWDELTPDARTMQAVIRGDVASLITKAWGEPVAVTRHGRTHIIEAEEPTNEAKLIRYGMAAEGRKITINVRPWDVITLNAIGKPPTP